MRGRASDPESGLAVQLRFTYTAADLAGATAHEVLNPITSIQGRLTRMLRALCLRLHEETGGPGVGAVGMCITGNFALALMVDPWLMAPVLSQPSLPFPTDKEARRGLHVSDDDLRVIQRRTREDGVKVLGLRFTGDPLCPKARFDRLRDELGAGFEGIEIDSRLGNPHGISPLAHSVLTEDLVDKAGHPTQRALHRVLALFDEKLRAPTG